jgi:hypothetical protein
MRECSTCKHFSKGGEDGFSVHGVCRRYPPIAFKAREEISSYRQPYAQFPLVSGKAVCGEYEAVS